MIKTVQYNIVCENKPGVLYRVANILLKRKINIETLTAYPIDSKKISTINFTTNVEESKINTIAKQIKKIIEVIDVNYLVIS
jgi:acetolactate synthase I/III small subunit